MGEKRERVKQKLYDFICDEQYKPMRLKDIRFLLQVKDADKKRVEEALNELVEEGKITVTPKGKYKKLDDKFLVGYVMMIFKVTKDLSKTNFLHFQSPRKIKKRQRIFLAGWKEI